MQCTKGKLVEVQTVWGEHVEGRTFSNSNDTSPLLLLQTETGGQQGFRIFSSSAVVSLRELEDPHPTKLIVLPQYSEEESKKRELEAKRKVVSAGKKIGAGVSMEAQVTFNAIEKLYPQTRWSGQSIIVMDVLAVNPPYQVENCTFIKADPPTKNPHLLKLVKQIIERLPKKS